MPRLTPEQYALVEKHADLPQIAVRAYYRTHGLRFIEEDGTFQDLVGDATEHLCKLAVKFNGQGDFRGFAMKRYKWFFIDWLRENGRHSRSGRVRPTMQSWDTKLSQQHDDEVTGDHLMREEDRDQGFVDEVGGMEFFKFALKKLSEREQRILWMRYVEGITLREIGEDYGVTEGRISQIESAALAKLRKDMDVVQTAAAIR